MKSRLALIGFVLALWAPGVAAANITLLVGFPPGQGAETVGGPDATSEAGARLASGTTYEDIGRFYAERLGAFLPGAPGMTMKSTPGAGGLLAARTLANASARTPMLGLLGPRVAFDSLTNLPNAAWRAADFHWIGALTRTDDVCVVRADSGVANLADLKRHEVFMATLPPGSRTWIYARALNELAGARLHIISGYGSSFEATRALATGETQAWCGWSASDVLYRQPAALHTSGARPLLRFSVSRENSSLDLPLAENAVPGEPERQAMGAIATQTRFGAYALAAPPQTPPDIVAAWRAGFLAMAHDPETLHTAELRGIDVDPVAGEELQALAQRLDSLAPDARAALARVLR